MELGIQLISDSVTDDKREHSHWSERGRATSVGNSDALGRPRRSVPLGGSAHAELRTPQMPKPKCIECGKDTLRIHPLLNVPLCSSCKSTHPDKYGYITKTRALQEFRLRVAELDTLPRHEVDNPHYKSGPPMQLYLLPSVKELAARKWGNAEPYIVTLAEFGPEQMELLLADSERLKHLSPEKFEHFIADRLERMGLGVKMVGRSNQPDGGVDIIAYPKIVSVPFLIAVQVKHHQNDRKTGAPDVRNFHSVLSSGNGPFCLGMLVTNTTFTADAQWFADNNSTLLRLRDIQDLRRWMKEDFANEHEWREIPDVVELGPGIRITIPKPRLWTP